MIRTFSLVAAVLASAGGGCTGTHRGDLPQSAEDAAAQSVQPDAQDTIGVGLIPAGYGSLRQEDIAIRLQLEGVQVRAIPLEESIIRVLSPDSYRALRDLVESRRSEIARIASRNGARAPSVWYVAYYGLAPEARYSPMEVAITSGGMDFRPLELIPLSTGFGENILKQRETKAALYVFGDGVNVEQPLTFTVESARSTDWQATLRVIDRERALVRTRAGT